MMYKLIFGIILPLMIIISLAIIASYGEVKEEREFLKVISIQTVLKDGNIRDKVKIGDIVLTNDFTLPKRYELPLFGACLIDSDNYTELLERYKGYDSVVIYEKKERKSSNYPYSYRDYVSCYNLNEEDIKYRDYVSCYNLNEEDIKDSIKIQLTP